MSQEAGPENAEVKRIRLLKPSAALYLVLGLAVLLVWAALAFLLFPLQYALVFLAFFALAPIGVIKPLAFAISKRAEYAQTEKGQWFEFDVEREKRRYGPLRANRRFGHPIGQKKHRANET